MKLEQIQTKVFRIRGAVKAGEVQIRPPMLTGGPKVVRIATWNEKGRWMQRQEVEVDMAVIAAILSEGDDAKG